MNDMLISTIEDKTFMFDNWFIVKQEFQELELHINLKAVIKLNCNLGL